MHKPSAPDATDLSARIRLPVATTATVALAAWLLAVFAGGHLPSAASAQGEEPAPSVSPLEDSTDSFPAIPPRRAPSPPASPMPQDPPHEPLQGAREVLDLLGVDPSYFEMLHDGHPLGLDEEAALFTLLYASGRFPLVRLEPLAQRDWTIESLSADPAHMRGEVFLIEGYVHHVQRHEPPAELADQFQLPKYFECRITLGESDTPVIVYTQTIPQAWHPGQDMRERVAARAIFLKLAGDPQAEVPQPPTPVFVAPRLAWHPDNFLGRIGMDAGLLDNIRQRAPLMSQDRETFYQLLARSNRMDPAALRAAAAHTQQQFAELAKSKQTKDTLAFRMGQMLADPARFQGEVMQFTGMMKRAVKVRVPDADIRQRFDIDHYYELQMFLDLEYEIKDKETGEKHRFASYPITVCVRNLPPGLPEGENLRELVQVTGVFLKIWSYESVFAISQGENKRQMAPLLVAPTISWLQPVEKSNSFAGWIAVGLFTLAIGGIWLGIWRYNRDVRRIRQFTHAHPSSPPDLQALSDLDKKQS